MNVDCVGVRRRPNNRISGGPDAPWMLSASLPEGHRSRQAGMDRDEPVSLKLLAKDIETEMGMADGMLGTSSELVGPILRAAVYYG